MTEWTLNGDKNLKFVSSRSFPLAFENLHKRLDSYYDISNIQGFSQNIMISPSDTYVPQPPLQHSFPPLNWTF